MKRSSVLTITVDPTSTSMAVSIRAAAEAAPLLVVSSRALSDLADELGSMESAAEHLQGVAEAIGKPIAVNLPTGADTTSTVFIAPKNWTEERLAGWAAGHHQALEAEFGRVQRVRPLGANRAERRRRNREN